MCCVRLLFLLVVVLGNIVAVFLGYVRKRYLWFGNVNVGGFMKSAVPLLEYWGGAGEGVQGEGLFVLGLC